MFTPPRLPRQLLPDDGSAAVEYAITVVVAATLAVVLLTLIKGDAVMNGLKALVDSALSVP